MKMNTENVLYDLGLQSFLQTIIFCHRYKDPLRKCIDYAMETNNISQMIGLHIRTWMTSVSLVSNACSKINGYNPLRWIFACDLTDKLVIGNIDRVLQNVSPGQRVFIATDDVENRVVKAVRNHFPERIFQYQISDLKECLRKQNLAQDDLEFWLAVGYPIIQNEMLVGTQYFIGSFFSTFSQVVALKRNLERTEFFQSAIQRFLHKLLPILGVTVVVTLVLLPTIIRLRKKYKN